MCKRLVIPEQEDAEKEISVAKPWWKFTVRFNVAVKHRVPVARLHNKITEGVMMQWGFVPPPERQKQQEISVGAALVPSDAVLTCVDYRRAWLYGQRCVIPLAGFYVWHLDADGVSRPSYVRLVNRAVFGVAGLWERTVLDEGEDVIESCALLTVPANRLIAEIDDDQRMPAILRREEYDEWLTSTASKAQSLLRTYPLERMVTHPVGPRVNYPEFDDADLIRPAAV
ncbi:MAG TPA: SOS response-associated peptidase family protein [Steroidobacteraceae bacterium]